MKTKNLVDNCINILGLSFSLSNIESILGIIVLVLTILNMCWKVFDKIYTKLKDDDKTNDLEIVKDITDGAKEIKEVIDNFKKGNDKDGTN